MTKEDKRYLYFSVGVLAAGMLSRYLLGRQISGRISKHFYLDQVSISQTAEAFNKDNTPPPKALALAKKFSNQILDPLVDQLGFRPEVSSWYRSGELTEYLYTKLWGGYRYSDHQTGGTVDLDSPGNTKNYEITRAILEMNIPFNQLILEKGTLLEPNWIHLSWFPGNNDREILFLDPSTGDYIPISENYLRSIYGL